MKEKKEYRSAIRSRKLIRQAFLELLREKPFEKITVTDIAKKADINRSTFYAHYPDLLGVVDEIKNEIIAEFIEFLEEMNSNNFFENPKYYLNETIKLLEKNRELFYLLGTSSMLVKQLEKLKSVIIDSAINTVRLPEKYQDSFKQEFYIRFFMSGLMELYIQWVNGEINCSLNEITENIAELIVQADSQFV